jgi:hypothetical protein
MIHGHGSRSMPSSNRDLWSRNVFVWFNLDPPFKHPNPSLSLYKPSHFFKFPSQSKHLAKPCKNRFTPFLVRKSQVLVRAPFFHSVMNPNPYFQPETMKCQVLKFQKPSLLSRRNARFDLEPSLNWASPNQEHIEPYLSRNNDQLNPCLEMRFNRT